MRTFTDIQLAERACTRVARILFELWEESGGANTRVLDWLIEDRFVVIGRSPLGQDYAEHVVPLAYIRDRCLECFRRDNDFEGAVGVIRKLLKVAYISKEEAARLNAIPGLRNGMPEGWDPNTGDCLDRLRAAGIELEPIDTPIGTTRAASTE